MRAYRGAGLGESHATAARVVPWSAAPGVYKDRWLDRSAAKPSAGSRNSIPVLLRL